MTAAAPRLCSFALDWAPADYRLWPTTGNAQKEMAMDGLEAKSKEKGRIHFPTRLRIMLETNAARDKAEVLLSGLINAQTAMSRHDVAPVSSRIVSRSSIDRAIASTQRLIDSLNTALDMAQDDLRDDRMSILDEIDDDAPSAGPQAA